MALAAIVDVMEAMAAVASPTELDTIAASLRLANFRGNAAAGRKAGLVDLMQSMLVPLRTELNATHGLDDADLAQLLSDPAAINWDAHPEANTFTPWSDPAPIDHGLRQYYRVHERRPLFNAQSAWAIFSAYRADPGAWAPAGSVDDQVKQLVNLCALKGALSRIVIAMRARTAAGATLAEALALYRTEGNLIVPYDAVHQAKLLPPCERGFDFSYGFTRVNRKVSEAYRLGLKKTMQNGLWSQDKKRFIAVNGTGGDDFDRFAFLVAFIDWHVIMVGFDFLFARFDQFGSTMETYLKFLLDLRVANGLAAANSNADQQQLQAEVTAVVGKLTKSEDEGRIFLKPDDLEGALSLAAFLLTQALLFFKASGKAEVDGPFITPNATLRYLAYNTSHRRSIDLDANPKDLFSSVLASAAVALASKAINAVPAYCSNAYTSLGLAGLPDTLPDESESPEHAAAAAQVKAALTDSGEMEQFAQFILRATAREWGSYLQNRGNLARYTRLLSFYTALTAGMGV